MTRAPRSETAQSPPRAHPLRVAVLVLALALALPAAAAHAGSNSGVDGCMSAYNYADPSTNYLYASSHGSTLDCEHVYVDIANPYVPIAWNEGWGSTSTSIVLPSGQWNNPLSAHIAADCSGCLDRYLKLDFLY